MTYELIQGDCEDILSTFADKSIAAAIIDPPYGIGESREKIMSRGRVHGSNGLLLTDYGDFDWDSKPASPEALAHIRRITKTQAIFGGNYFDLPPTNCWLIWDKLNSGDFADGEMAWTNLDRAVRIFRHRWNGMIRASEQGKRFHPTQKPVALMRWVIEQLHIPAGATILDAYMGSGPVGVAAIQLGYNYIGIEKDERYFQIAKRRIEDASRAAQGLPKVLQGKSTDTAGLPMFEAYA